MAPASPENFRQYLKAKKSVDDRSLNHWVYHKLTEGLAARGESDPLRIIEIGCGLGGMLERLWDRRLASRAAYTAFDRDPDLIAEAGLRLQEFAQHRGLTILESGGAVRLAGDGQNWLITLRTEEFSAFCQQQARKTVWDLVLAHAFLDLVDLAAALPGLFSLLAPDGLYYFTLNFDGLTIIDPPLDPHLDDTIFQLYHQSMDERQDGAGGHSRTGRRLLSALRRSGSHILAAGSSDWVVWPTPSGTYPGEEAYFLHSVLNIIDQTLAGHPELDHDRFQVWLARRREQVDSGELIFLAHQVDVCGLRP